MLSTHEIETTDPFSLKNWSLLMGPAVSSWDSESQVEGKINRTSTRAYSLGEPPMVPRADPHVSQLMSITLRGQASPHC